jgi:hypothetical protein
MAMVTLGETARLPGFGKTTLARAIELARVYPFPAPTVAADTTVTATGTAPPATPTTTGATVALEAQIAGLREVGELLRRQLDDVREDRDRWRGQAERLAVTSPPPSRSWWRRLAGQPKGLAER